MTGAARLAQFIEDRARETYREQEARPGYENQHDAINRELIPHVAEHLPVGAKVLDVGAGYGSAMQGFAALGHDVTGIDVNEENRAACKERGLTVLDVEMHDLGRWRGVFDLVWARHVLEHSIAPFFALSEFFRVLKPGGLLYVEVPAPGTVCEHEVNANHYAVMGDRMWLCLISKAGFRMFEQLKMEPMTGRGRDVYHAFLARKARPLPCEIPPHIPASMGWEMETMREIFCSMLIKANHDVLIADSGIHPFRYLEIGAAEMGTIRAVRDFLRASGIEAECIGTDLAKNPYGTKSEDGIRMIYEESPKICFELEGRFNFVFIDGCHCLVHLWLDWNAVRPWVKPGGIVAFHDTSPDYQERIQTFDNSKVETRRFLEESGLLDGTCEGWRLLADDLWNSNGITFVQKL